MALEKVVEVDQIEVKGEYSIQVRQATKVLDDGKQIGGVSYHRHVVHPNSSLDNEDAKVKKIAEALFDADCIEAYFVSQNGHPSGDPSDSWTLAQLQKYCDNRNITHYPEAVEAVDAVEAVEEVLWAEGDELPEGVEVGDVKTEAVEGVDAVEAKAKDTKASLLSAIPSE
jgi:hypothetical protein